MNKPELKELQRTVCYVFQRTCHVKLVLDYPDKQHQQLVVHMGQTNELRNFDYMRILDADTEYPIQALIAEMAVAIAEQYKSIVSDWDKPKAKISHSQ